MEQILSVSGPISTSVVFITSFPVWNVSNDLFFDSDRHLRSLLEKIIDRSNLAFRQFFRPRSRDEKPYRASWLLLRSIRSSV